MKKLQKSEKELIGSWVKSNGSVECDDTCLRIQFLTANVLKEIKIGNWCALYQDPNDDRYWELTYPQSQLHGGGPESLVFIPDETAEKKYKLSDSIEVAPLLRKALAELEGILPTKDNKMTSELLDHNELGLALENLIHAIYEDSLCVPEVVLLKVTKAAKIMNYDTSSDNDIANCWGILIKLTAINKSPSPEES